MVVQTLLLSLVKKLQGSLPTELEGVQKYVLEFATVKYVQDPVNRVDHTISQLHCRVDSEDRDAIRKKGLGPDGTGSEIEVIQLNSDRDDETWGFVPRSFGTTELKGHLFKE